MPNVVFHSLSILCQYLTLNRLLVLCHYAKCCLSQSVHIMSVPHTETSLGSVPLCPILSSRVCPHSVSTSHSTVCGFCVTLPTVVFHSLSNVCQYLTLYPPLVLCHYAKCCLPHSVHSVSVPHTVPSVGSLSLCLLLSSKVCPLSVSSSHCTLCWFSVTMSTAAF